MHCKLRKNRQWLTTMPMSVFSLPLTSTVLSTTRFMNWSKPRSVPTTIRLAFNLTVDQRNIINLDYTLKNSRLTCNKMWCMFNRQLQSIKELLSNYKNGQQWVIEFWYIKRSFSFYKQLQSMKSMPNLTSHPTNHQKEG